MKKNVLFICLLFGFIFYGNYGFGKKPITINQVGNFSVKERSLLRKFTAMISIPVTNNDQTFKDMKLTIDGKTFEDRNLLIKHIRDKFSNIKVEEGKFISKLDLQMPAEMSMPQFYSKIQNNITLGEFITLIENFSDKASEKFTIDDFFECVFDENGKLLSNQVINEKVQEVSGLKEDKGGSSSEETPPSKEEPTGFFSWSWIQKIKEGIGGFVSSFTDYFKKEDDKANEEQVFYCMLKHGLEVKNVNNAYFSVSHLRCMIEYAKSTLLKSELKSALPSDGTFFLESGEGCSMTVEQFLGLLESFAVKQAQLKRFFNVLNFNVLNKDTFIKKIAEDLKDVKETTINNYYNSFFKDLKEVKNGITENLSDFYKEQEELRRINEQRRIDELKQIEELKKQEEEFEERKRQEEEDRKRQEELKNGELSRITQLLQVLKNKLTVLLEKIVTLAHGL